MDVLNPECLTVTIHLCQRSHHLEQNNRKLPKSTGYWMRPTAAISGNILKYTNLLTAGVFLL